jgi:hypothetical protein
LSALTAGVVSDACSSKAEMVKSTPQGDLQITEWSARNEPAYTPPRKATSLTLSDSFWVGDAGRTSHDPYFQLSVLPSMSQGVPDVTSRRSLE